MQYALIMAQINEIKIDRNQSNGNSSNVKNPLSTCPVMMKTAANEDKESDQP
jgi:hypothetical protein